MLYFQHLPMSMVDNYKLCIHEVPSLQWPKISIIPIYAAKYVTFDLLF